MAYYVQLFNLSERDAISDGDPNPRGENLAHLSIAFGCLAGFFVILRLLTRGFYNKRIGADDVLIVMAMVCKILQGRLCLQACLCCDA